MGKNDCKTVKLAKGEMNVFDFGDMQLHAYKTNDLISDELFIVVRGGKAVFIEAPCFFDNIRELEEYSKANRFEVAGMLLAYHMAGATFLPSARKYATKNADVYGHTGGGSALITNFAAAFGDSFDSSVYTVTDYLTEGEVEIGGIRFIITQTADAFDIAIPAINAVYTHMLGHNCHSIVANGSHADAVIALLRDYIEKGYDLILTSHDTPEDLSDVRTKIAYLEELKKLAAASKSREEFKEKMLAAFPSYGGLNYLDMTAGMFFPQDKA